MLFWVMHKIYLEMTKKFYINLPIYDSVTIETQGIIKLQNTERIKQQQKLSHPKITLIIRFNMSPFIMACFHPQKNNTAL